MLTKQERDALSETLQDAIMQNAPSAVPKHMSDDLIAYQIVEEGEPRPFCLLHIRRDHIEVRFPNCPSEIAHDSRFEPIEGSTACRLIVRERTDIPGEILIIAITAAAEGD